MVGYIKLHRKILEWEWYDDSNTFRLFIHCLIEANHKDREWRGIKISRGQFHTSIGILAVKLKLSDKAIRIALDKLIKTKEVAIKGASNGTMITICNYDSYQGFEEAEWQTEGQAKGKPKGKRGATTKEYKEEKEIKETKEEIKYTCLTFEDFWDLYDKKVGKPNAIKLFEKTTEKERELIKAYIPKYKLSKPEVKYRKDPERFLKNRVWEDEIISDKQIVIEKTEKDIFSLTFKELKDELLLNYTIPRDDLFYASYEMLIENYKSGKYPKK